MKKLEKKHKEQKAAINFTYQDGEAPKPPPSKPEEETSDMEESDDEGQGALFKNHYNLSYETSHEITFILLLCHFGKEKYQVIISLHQGPDLR